jgi:hypothetical protein
MAENPSPQLSESDKLAAMLAELEAERQKRVNAGQWSKDVRPRLMAIPQAGETLEAAQQREVYRYLAEHPDAPKAIAAYEWMELEVVDPPPQVELPAAQWDQPDTRVVVSPPPYRPPMPPAPPPPEPWLPSRKDRIIETHNAIKRREKQFHDGDWKPHDGALRYPRGRNGW